MRRKGQVGHQTTIRECQHCFQLFAVKLKDISYSDRTQKKRAGIFCSQNCKNANRTKNGYLLVNCGQCGLQIRKHKSLIAQSKSGLTFCSKSCFGKYNMAHKTTGTKRSKLEKYIEMQICKEFPDLQFKTNSIEEIGCELDFFFPDLNLGLEINGAFHYEAIHGIERLQGIQRNDKKKVSICAQKRINLIVYKDINHQFKSIIALTQWEEIKQILKGLISVGLSKPPRGYWEKKKHGKL